MLRCRTPGFREFFLARAAALRGDRVQARQIAEELAKRATRGEAFPSSVAWSYIAAGDRDKAFEWFDRALDARDVQILASIRSPILKDLKADSRYAELLRRVERGFED